MDQMIRPCAGSGRQLKYRPSVEPASQPRIASGGGQNLGDAGSTPALAGSRIFLPITTKGRGSPARIVMVRLERTDSYPEPNAEPETAPSAREHRPARVQSVVEPEVKRAAGRGRSLVPVGPASIAKSAKTARRSGPECFPERARQQRGGGAMRAER